MSEIPFKVSARTAKLIGLENFSNAEGAVIELVKNTYDADSKLCVVLFDLKYDELTDSDGVITKKLNKPDSAIYIIDSGEGMTDDIISNQWMTIGTDDKLYNHLTPNGRVKTGAKGIGRFALNRLGQQTEMLTFSSKKSFGYRWGVDWRHFDLKGANVSDVKAILEDRPNLNVNNELSELIKEFPDFESVLKDEILKDPLFKTGTIIKITHINDNWDVEQLEKLFLNLQILLPPKEQEDFKIWLFLKDQPVLFGKVKGAYYDDYDYKLEAEYLADSDRTLNIKITRKELDLAALKKDYKQVFEAKSMQNFPFRLEDMSDESVEFSKSLTEMMSEVEPSLIDDIGAFNFSFYYLKNSISDDKDEGNIKKYPYRNFSSTSRRAWLRKFGGVKIFRDDFRIRPYGENGEDWLKLGERQAQSPGGAGQKLGGFRIRPNQISGTVNISRISNQSFQDKSGREGLQENEVFELFKNILKEIISVFELDRNIIMFNLSELHKKRNKEEEAKRKAKAEADRINQENEAKANQPNTNSRENEDTGQGDQPSNSVGGTQNNNAPGSPTAAESSLAKGYAILEEELEEKNQEIRLLRNFASVGLIISSFAHEVKSLRSRLQPRSTHLLRELRLHLDESKFNGVDPDDNPFYMIKLIQEEDTKLKHWLDYSLNTLKRDKRERRNINLPDYFESFKSTWNKAVEQRNAKIVLSGNDDEKLKVRAFEVDLDSIFNNLLSNSLNALKGVSREKIITIHWMLAAGEASVIFSDNGKGLDKKYHSNPDIVFNLLESSKTDKKGEIIGTGLGLYIVKSVVEEYNGASISIVEIENGFSLKITFSARN